MERQLVLIDLSADWHLDDYTREVGLRGVAEAREVLKKAVERQRLEEARKAKRPAA